MGTICMYAAEDAQYIVTDGGADTTDRQDFVRSGDNEGRGILFFTA